jgi:hypothetical protein
MSRPLKIRRSRQVLWGYDLCPDNPLILIPDDDALDLYDEGVSLLSQGRSYTQIAKWITECTGRRLTREALWKKVAKARKDRQKAQYREAMANSERELRAYCEKNTAASHQAQGESTEAYAKS